MTINRLKDKTDGTNVSITIEPHELMWKGNYVMLQADWELDDGVFPGLAIFMNGELVRDAHDYDDGDDEDLCEMIMGDLQYFANFNYSHISLELLEAIERMLEKHLVRDHFSEAA